MLGEQLRQSILQAETQLGSRSILQVKTGGDSEGKVYSSNEEQEKSPYSGIVEQAV